MISDDLRRRVGQTPKLPRLAYSLMLFGMMIVVASFIIGIALGISTADHFENAKSVRDAAEPGGQGSGILSQLGTIKATTAWLTPFKFVGIAMFLSGISTFFFVIIRSLQLRGEAMRVAIPEIMGAHQMSAD